MSVSSARCASGGSPQGVQGGFELLAGAVQLLLAGGEVEIVMRMVACDQPRRQGLEFGARPS